MLILLIIHYCRFHDAGQKFAVMEEKIILAHLFRNFRMEAVTKKDEVVIMMELIIRSKNGLNIQLIPRNDWSNNLW